MQIHVLPGPSGGPSGSWAGGVCPSASQRLLCDSQCSPAWPWPQPWQQRSAFTGKDTQSNRERVADSVGGQAFNCLGDIATERERVQLQGSVVATVPCRSLLPSLESKWGIVVPWGSREAKLVFELLVRQAARHSLGLIITHLQKGIWHSDGRLTCGRSCSQ